MNCTSRYDCCRPAVSQNHSHSTGVHDETAATFGFRLTHNYKHDRSEEKFILERGDIKLEFDTLEQAQCWLKGYEFHVFISSEYNQ